MCRVAYPRHNIFDESVFAFILAGNLVNFKCSGIGNYVHHLVWRVMPAVALPYSVWGIVYLNTAYQSLLQINEMLHTFLYSLATTFGALWV